MDPNSPDRTLKIVKLIGLDTEFPKRLTVRISFDSFLKPIKEMALWEGSMRALLRAQVSYWLTRTSPGRAEKSWAITATK